MNDLSVDIGYKSINHHGEYLCGDHVDVVQQENSDSKVPSARSTGWPIPPSPSCTLSRMRP